MAAVEHVRASKKAAEREGVEEDGRTETWPFLPLPTTRAVATTSSRGSASSRSRCSQPASIRLIPSSSCSPASPPRCSAWIRISEPQFDHALEQGGGTRTGEKLRQRWEAEGVRGVSIHGREGVGESESRRREGEEEARLSGTGAASVYHYYTKQHSLVYRS